MVIAGEQTVGRGRMGRSFYSPGGSGIYLSLLLRPVNADPRQTVTLTAAAAAALCQAMEDVSGKSPQIKWVNDIFLNGRKVSGILTEAAFGLESGAPEYVVVGVGINACAPEGGFPPELAEIAGVLWDKPVPDGNVLNRVGDGCGAGGCCKSRRPAFQCGNAFFKYIRGRIHQARINVAALRQSKPAGSLRRILKYIRGGGINRHCSGIRCRVCFFLTDMKL